MNYLYITLNKTASQYAISLDEIFLTLYGYTKKRRIALSAKGFKKESYDHAITLSEGGIPGIVYRMAVTEDQHDDVRDILCDFLMDSHTQKHRIKRGNEDFSSAEFIAYILDRAGIISFENSESGIAEEDLAGLADFSNVDIIYEGDLRKYVAEKRQRTKSEPSNVRHLHNIKKNKKVMEYGTAKYEYVPDEMQKLVTAD